MLSFHHWHTMYLWVAWMHSVGSTGWEGRWWRCKDVFSDLSNILATCYISTKRKWYLRVPKDIPWKALRWYHWGRSLDLDCPQDTNRQAIRPPSPSVTQLEFSSVTYNRVSTSKSKKMNLLGQIFIIFDQEFCGTEQWAQLGVIESHFGARHTIVANWRADKVFIWVGSSIRAHAALEATGILRAVWLTIFCIWEWVSCNQYRYVGT